MKMFKAITVMACFMALSISVDRAFSDETRTCKAYYEVVVESVDDIQSPNLKHQKLVEFFGRGRCRNRLSANECRRIARDYSHDCMKTHWQNADRNVIPDECQPNHDKEKTGVNNYNIKYLLDTIKKAACSALPAAATANNKKVKVVYSLYGITSGDDGCGPNTKNTERRKIATSSCNCP